MATEQSTVSILLELKDRATVRMENFNKTMRKTTRISRDVRNAVRGMSLSFAGLVFAASRVQITQDLAIRSITDSLQKLGIAYADVSEEINTQTAELQAKTNFGDERQIVALDQLLIKTQDYEKALKLLPLVLDVAAGNTVTLETATRNVSNAVLLSRGTLVEDWIPALKKAGTEAERIALITAIYGGKAEAASLPIKQMGNSLGDLLEALRVNDSLDKGAKVVTAFAEAIKKVPVRVLKALGAGLVALTVAFIVAAGFAVVANSFVQAMAAAKLLTGGIRDLVGMLMKRYVPATSVAGQSTLRLRTKMLGLVATVAIVGFSIAQLASDWDRSMSDMDQVTGKTEATTANRLKSLGNVILDWAAVIGLAIAGVAIGIAAIVGAPFSAGTSLGLLVALPLIGGIIGSTIPKSRAGRPDPIIEGLEDVSQGLTGGVSSTGPSRSRSAGGNVSISVPQSSIMFMDNERSLTRLARLVAKEIAVQDRTRARVSGSLVA